MHIHPIRRCVNDYRKLPSTEIYFPYNWSKGSPKTLYMYTNIVYIIYSAHTTYTFRYICTHRENWWPLTSRIGCVSVAQLLKLASDRQQRTFSMLLMAMASNCLHTIRIAPSMCTLDIISTDSMSMYCRINLC